VLFIEEPIQNGTDHEDTVLHPTDHITVIQPNISWPLQTQELEKVVNKYVKEYRLKDPILWFYSAACEEISEYVKHDLIVYDCMDELSAFAGAPQSLIDKEKKLLLKADIVFTGGKSLYDSKKQMHANVHCFPSSVDKKHFEKALQKDTAAPEEIQKIQKKKVGFYGVIDERLDLQLLDEVAQKLPDYEFIMIGPVVKINPDTLPHRPNISYTGGKTYEELPLYLKAFDIAMMPFALNKSTKFISPTKTLEFMAALKPIISTPIYDVVRDYRDIVKIVETSDQFVAAIHEYSNETAEQKMIRENKEKQIVEQTSWDNTKNAMEHLIELELQKKEKKIQNTHAPQLDYIEVL
jgi:glycosyltransferase involved in cell wall biosynthesis